MTKFQIQLKGILNEQETFSEIKKQISVLETQLADLKIKIDADGISELKGQIKNVNTEFQNSASIQQKATAAINSGIVKNTIKYQEQNNELKAISQTIKEINGNVAKTTSFNLDTMGAPVANSVAVKEVTDLTYDTKQREQELKALEVMENKLANQLSNNTKQQILLEGELASSVKKSSQEEYLTKQELLKVQKEYITLSSQELEANGKVTSKAKEYNYQIDAINRSLNEQNAKIAVLNKNGDSFWTKITAKAKEYFNYAVAAMALQQTTQLINNMVIEVVQLDAALVELQKVTDLEGDSLDNFTEKAYAAGEAVAATGREMIEAATEFAKAGYNPDEALVLGEVAMMYTNIADEAITAAEASEFMIAQMKAFNLTAEDSMHIIDALNEVANNFAVSSADIADNMGNSSAVMAAAGNSYEQMIGLMTAGTEITRDASRVSNGLKSITLNLQGMDDEGNKSLELMSSMEDLFSKLGLSVYDSNGNLKNTYDLLAELAPVYNSATTEMKSFITETIAGKLKFA